MHTASEAQDRYPKIGVEDVQKDPKAGNPTYNVKRKS